MKCKKCGYVNDFVRQCPFCSPSRAKCLKELAVSIDGDPPAVNGVNMIKCPVCHLHVSKPGRASTESGDQLFTCLGCSHVWQHPLEVRAEYNQKYITERYDAYDTTTSMSWLRLGLVRSFVSGGRLLDIGYGNGSFLKAAGKAKFEAHGYDVHGLGDRYGVKEASLDEGKWDVVTLFDSIEHFDDLSAIRTFDDRSPFIIVSTPYRPSFFPDFLDWKHFRPGEHLHYFSKVSLSVLFPSHELILVSDIEDAVRGSCKIQGRDDFNNIMTCVFGPSQRYWTSQRLE